jgi:hypothetical protein
VKETQQRIYNSFLKNLRYGQPFKPRKDFSDLSSDVIVCLEKLDLFFSKYKHININEYFEAPIFIYPNETYPPLNYFLTRNAIRAYKNYKNQKEDENPENQLEEIKKSIIFIGKFCIKNNISMFDYLNHKNGYVYSWINHYRERLINPYSLMELGDFEKKLYSLLEEEIDIYASNLAQKLESYKVRYHNSTKTKQVVKQSTKKIENFIQENLQNKKINVI